MSDDEFLGFSASPTTKINGIHEEIHSSASVSAFVNMFDKKQGNLTSCRSDNNFDRRFSLATSRDINKGLGSTACSLYPLFSDAPTHQSSDNSQSKKEKQSFDFNLSSTSSSSSSSLISIEQPQPPSIFTRRLSHQHNTNNQLQNDQPSQLKKTFALANLANTSQLEVAELANMSRMERYNIDDLDVNQVPGYTFIPENIPQWKKHHIERKNKEAINEYLKTKEKDDMEKKRYGDIPQWKKDLLMKKEKQSIEKAVQEESDKFGNIPQWKKNLLSKKQNSPTKP